MIGKYMSDEEFLQRAKDLIAADLEIDVNEIKDIGIDVEVPGHGEQHKPFWVWNAKDEEERDEE